MTNIEYQYEDESAIDDTYKCSICTKPFQRPVTTPCDHTYCQACVQHWLDQKHCSCPTCQQALASNDLTPITTRLVLGMLDKLLVKCSQCGANRIERGNLADHMTKLCPKTIVLCTAADIQCPWTGTRDKANEHLSTCNYEQLRSVLSQLIVANGEFEQQIQTLTDHVQTLQQAVHRPTSRLITFDKLTDVQNKTDSGTIPELYHGLRWVNVWYMDERWARINHQLSGWRNAFTHDHTCVAFNGKGTSMKICSRHKGTQTFSLVSFEATAAWHDDLQVQVLGRKVKQEMYSTQIGVQFDRSKVFRFDWKDIDEVKLIPLSGTAHPGVDYDDKYFALTWIMLG